MLTLIVAMLMGGCVFSQNRSRWRTDFLHEIEKAPPAERQKRNPYEGQPQAVTAGQKLFRRHCAQCHGEEGLGTERAPDLHSPSVRKATPGELAWFLKNGNLPAGMPSWAQLPDQRRWQLVAYLKSLD
jgi:cytochrome c oxidase cbb3-type subunit 2